MRTTQYGLLLALASFGSAVRLETETEPMNLAELELMTMTKLETMLETMTETELEAAIEGGKKKVVYKMDANDDGYVSPQELIDYMKETAGITVTKPQAESTLRKYAGDVGEAAKAIIEGVLSSILYAFLFGAEVAEDVAVVAV